MGAGWHRFISIDEATLCPSGSGLGLLRAVKGLHVGTVVAGGSGRLHCEGGGGCCLGAEDAVVAAVMPGAACASYFTPFTSKLVLAPWLLLAGAP